MKLTYMQRLEAALKYKNGEGTYERIAKEYGIKLSSLQEIVSKYESLGKDGLKDTSKYMNYSDELKRRAVEDYLSGGTSLLEICRKYKIRSKTALRDWIKWYNGHSRSNRTKGQKQMTKGRKTTQEERAEIVAFCIEHGKNYVLTSETYNVSYQQIYAWVRKYEKNGIDGLADNRGRTKPKSEMTNEEKLRAENKILETKIKELEMENAFLKKLRELRGGDH